jgi:hypothetical protein
VIRRIHLTTMLAALLALGAGEIAHANPTPGRLGGYLAARIRAAGSGAPTTSTPSSTSPSSSVRPTAPRPTSTNVLGRTTGADRLARSARATADDHQRDHDVAAHKATSSRAAATAAQRAASTAAAQLQSERGTLSQLRGAVSDRTVALDAAIAADDRATQTLAEAARGATAHVKALSKVDGKADGGKADGGKADGGKADGGKAKKDKPAKGKAALEQDGPDPIAVLADAKAKALATSGAVTAARAALASATIEVQRGEGAVAASERRATDASAAATRAEQLAVADEATAARTRSTLDRSIAKAEQAEEHLAAVNKRIDHARARQDEHRYRLFTGKDRAAQAGYKRAVARTRTASFIVSKPGEASQDAVAAAPERGLFAIADGVTNSDFSGELARALVRGFTEQRPRNLAAFDSWLSGAQAEWQREVQPAIDVRAQRIYNRGKSWTGHAAFVGARLFDAAGRRKLHLMGIGDTVAFQVRGGRVKRGFPLSESSQFSDTVRAIPSRGKPPFAIREEIWDVRPGDEIFMATDALAAWIFAESEAGRDPFPTLRAIKTPGQMGAFVDGGRAGTLPGRGVLNVDDTTLLRFVVPLASGGTRTK